MIVPNAYYAWKSTNFETYSRSYAMACASDTAPAPENRILSKISKQNLDVAHMSSIYDS